MDNLNNFQKIALSLIARSPGLGKVQLNKGLFLFDSIYYAFHKESYTGCTYIKEDYGPIPNIKYFNQLKKTLNKYTKTNIEYKGYFEKMSFYILDNVELPHFDKNIEKILVTVVNFISNKTAKELSELMHDEIYKKTQKRKPIPFENIVKWKIDNPENTNIEVHARELTKDDEAEILKLCSNK